MPAPQHPAVGRTSIRMFPSDWGPQFVHRVAAGLEIGPSAELGYYPVQICSVDYKKRDGVELELRLEEIESFRKSIDFARERLVFEDGEDKWLLLPAACRKRNAVATPSQARKPRRVGQHDGETP
jgi:hypothetical protein